MNENELIARKWLIKNNYSPTRVMTGSPGKWSNKEELIERGIMPVGYPDFKCSNNRWVEVKDISSDNLSIQLSQINMWSELINNGDKVFILYTRNHKIVSLIKITNKITVFDMIP